MMSEISSRHSDSAMMVSELENIAASLIIDNASLLQAFNDVVRASTSVKSEIENQNGNWSFK